MLLYSMKVTKIQEKQIVRDYFAEHSKRTLAKKYGCSTWKIRSILKTIPPRYHCETCNKPLCGKNTRFCSKSCYNKSKRKYHFCISCNLPLVNSKHIKYCENCSANCTRQSTIDIRHRRREKLINLAGGKCQKCNYNKCIDALHFHHRDKTTKKFSLSGSAITHRTWTTILEEAKKCDLLCANCHYETEHKLRQCN